MLFRSHGKRGINLCQGDQDAIVHVLCAMVGDVVGGAKYFALVGGPFSLALFDFVSIVANDQCGSYHQEKQESNFCNA